MTKGAASSTLFAALLLATPVGVLAQGTTPPPGAPDTAAAVHAPAQPAKTPGQLLVELDKWAEALPLLDAELKGEPKAPELYFAKVKALQGLHRYSEAKAAALQGLFADPMNCELRFEMGRSALEAGFAAEALQSWKPLLSDRQWGDAATTGSVDALLALGREAEARILLAEAVRKLMPPSPALLRRALQFSPGRDESLKILDALAQGDPSARGEIEILRNLYGAAPGALAEETLSGTLPVTLSIQEISSPSSTTADPQLGNKRYPCQAVSPTPMTTPGNAGVEDQTGTKGARLVVAVAMGDLKREWMALDSGASVVLLSPATVKTLGLKPLATAEHIGLGDRAPRPSNWVIVPQIQIGPLTFTNVPAMVLRRSTDTWKTTAGILPLRMFRHYGVLYDRRGGNLTLFPSGTPPEMAFGSPPTMLPNSVWVDGTPCLEVRVKETPNLFFMLGTRSDTTLLDASRADAMGIRPSAGRTAAQTATGLSGSFPTGLAENVDILIGTILFKMGKVHVSDLGTGYGIDMAGILGRDNLDRYKVYLDYQKNVMAFKRYDP